MKQHSKSYKESVSRGRMRTRKEKKALVIARQKSLTILPHVPDSKEGLILLAISHKYLTVSPATWWRHGCTDYDGVLEGIQRRLGKGYQGIESSIELKNKAYALFRRYVRQCQADALLIYPTLLELKKDVVNGKFSGLRISDPRTDTVQEKQ